jgi:ring-1,2-phenylacetyl-CoA epoxidase subunit PaaC
MNALLVERPNGDFAHTIVRQFFYSAFALPLWQALTRSRDETLAAIAAKSEKEARYHVRHAGDWFIRLGDGTDESRRRTEAAVSALWRYTGELFEVDETLERVIAEGIAADPRLIQPAWDEIMDEAFTEASLGKPDRGTMQTGGRSGYHTEHLGYILSDMQFLQRAYPGVEW